jgi:methanogenic corrinoid protein MtbC1
MFESSGFEIYDLGRDVQPSAFVDKAIEVDADIIALSTLMTTTMDGMKEVIDILKSRGIRNQYKVIIGGAPISQLYADRIGADGYARNAAEGVELVKGLIYNAVTAV